MSGAPIKHRISSLSWLLTSICQVFSDYIEDATRWSHLQKIRFWKWKLMRKLEIEEWIDEEVAITSTASSFVRSFINQKFLHQSFSSAIGGMILHSESEVRISSRNSLGLGKSHFSLLLIFIDLHSSPSFFPMEGTDDHQSISWSWLAQHRWKTKTPTLFYQITYYIYISTKCSASFFLKRSSSDSWD